MAGRLADTPRVRRHLPELRTDLPMRGTGRRGRTTAGVIRGPGPATAEARQEPTTAFGPPLPGRKSMDVQATDPVLMAGPRKVIAAGGVPPMAGEGRTIAPPAQTFSAASLASRLRASRHTREASIDLAADTGQRASAAGRVLVAGTRAEAVIAGTREANIIADLSDTCVPGVASFWSRGAQTFAESLQAVSDR